MNRITKISQKGLELLANLEGFKANPYLDGGNIVTIGYGTTRNPYTNKQITLDHPPIDKKTALDWMKKDCEWAEIITDKLTRDDLTQNEFDAIVMFTYNTGGYYTKKMSGKIQRIPYRLYSEVNNRSEYLEKIWTKTAITINGVFSQGLVNRRKKEFSFFNQSSTK